MNMTLGILFFALSFRSILFAEEVLNINDSHFEGQYHGLQTYWYEDETGAADIETIMSRNIQGKFLKGQLPVINRGHTTAAVWFKISIFNPSADTVPIYFHNPKSFNLVTELYVNKQLYGSLGPNDARSSRIIEFTLQPEQTATVYIKIKNIAGVIRSLFSFWTSLPNLSTHAAEEDGVTKVIITIFVMSLFFNFMFLFSYREKIYTYYIAYITFMALHAAEVLSLFGHEFIASYKLNFHIGSMFTVFLTLFTIEFFCTKSDYKKSHRVLSSFVLITLGFHLLQIGSVMIPSMYSFHPMVNDIHLMINTVTGLSIFFVSLYITIKTRILYNVLFCSAVGIFLVAGIAQAVSWSGLIDFLDDRFIFVGAAIENIFMLGALGYRIWQTEQDSIVAHKKVEEQLVSLQKLGRIKDEFLANTSHELRTPLNGILGFTGLIRKGIYGDDLRKLDVQITKIDSLARSLKNQVNTILDLSKSKVGGLRLQNSLVSLNELAEESKLLAEGLVVSRTGRTFECGESWKHEEHPVFVSDYEKLATIIRNLLGNAFKFADGNRENHVSLFFAYEDSNLVITVADTGIGIREQNLKDIFEEFKQVDGNSNRSYEGTGLGLTMVKQLVNLMNGTITVESELHVGTEFSVKIPAQKEVHLTNNIENKCELLPVFDGNLVARQKRADENIGYKILVVDDNPINCEVLQDILESSGYVVITALGGRQCLDILKQESIDLVLLDLMMPGVSGEDVIQECKQNENLRNIPIIVITARASQDDRLSVLGIGADEYLAKPIIGDEITLRVKNTTTRLELMQERIENSELKGQLSAARQVQEALIPQDSERVLAGFAFQEYFKPADDAGGDWYQFYHDEINQRIFVFIADVTGHGVSASIVTGLTYGAINGLFSEMKSWENQPSMNETLMKMMHVVDQTLAGVTKYSNKSMTALFVGFNLIDGKGLVVSAGHHWPIIITNEESRTLTLTPGVHLGFGAANDNKPESFRLENGESLFLYTDGLTENCGPDGKVLKPRKLLKFLSENRQAAGLKSKLLEHAQLIWQDHKANDDCTFLLIKRIKPYLGKKVA